MKAGRSLTLWFTRCDVLKPPRMKLRTMGDRTFCSTASIIIFLNLPLKLRLPKTPQMLVYIFISNKFSKVMLDQSECPFYHQRGESKCCHTISHSWNKANLRVQFMRYRGACHRRCYTEFSDIEIADVLTEVEWREKWFKCSCLVNIAGLQNTGCYGYLWISV